MKNYMTRFIQSSLSKGFFTWAEKIKQEKQKSRILKNAINYWGKNILASAFRSWSDFQFSEKEREVKEKYLAKEDEHKTLTKLKDSTDRDQKQEVHDLT